MNLTNDFKKQVVKKLIEERANFDGNDYDYSKQYGIAVNIYGLMVGGSSLDNLLAEPVWLTLGRNLGVNLNERKWNTAKTEVFNRIEEEILFCKEHAKAMVFVDDCEIGKTHTAKHLSATLQNCFYVDCSESKTRRPFTIALAKAIGVSSSGSTNDIKANIKYCLRNVEKPIIIIDEAGDLEYEAFLSLKELWNATDGHCGFYMMGADGLKAKIERGIANQKVGYREIFSRYSGKFKRVTPSDKQQRIQFYRELITTVITANCEDKALIPELVKKCLATNDNGDLFGLRRAETLLVFSNKK